MYGLVLALAAANAPLASAAAPRCHVVSDPSGDGAHKVGAMAVGPNDTALDVTSADVGVGVKNLVFVMRVAGLGDAMSQGPQTYQWWMNFELRGKSFAAGAMRAIDGTNFVVQGDFPEASTGVPAFTTTVPVTGSFDPIKNEIRVAVPRRLLPVIRPNKDTLNNLYVVSVSGAGLLATEDAAWAGATADQTKAPGPKLPLNATTCVRGS